MKTAVSASADTAKSGEKNTPEFRRIEGMAVYGQAVKPLIRIRGQGHIW